MALEVPSFWLLVRLVENVAVVVVKRRSGVAPRVHWKGFLKVQRAVGACCLRVAMPVATAAAM